MRRESSEELARAARARLDALVRDWPPVAGAGAPPQEKVNPADDGTGAPQPGKHAAGPGSGRADRLLFLSPPHRGRLVLALGVAILAVLVAAWSVWRSAPRPVPVASAGAAARTSGGSPPAGTPMSTAPSAGVGGSAKVVVVDVAGKVRHPGIATLPAGARVVDAIRRAGGVRPGVDLSGVNLARVLVDGEQILVGLGPVAAQGAGAAVAPAGPDSAPATGALVDLNTASATDLEGLPGVGPVTAQKVIAWRSAHGSFTAINELLEIPGIGPKTFAKIAPGVTL